MKNLTFTRCFRASFLAWAVVASAVTLVPAARAQNFIRTYYLPLAEQDVFDFCKTIHNGVKAPIDVRVQIVPTTTNTVLYYDHWEDGYETNVFSPVQSTSQIWGDGILTNGIAPGTTNDRMRAGHIIVLTNSVEIPRVATNIWYDARDRIVATLPVSIVRELNAKDPGEALADAINVYPQEMFGLRYVAPVGTNIEAGTHMFELTTMMVMAAEDQTLIEVDANADGVPEKLELLNRGEYYSAAGMMAGGSVQSTKPIEAYLLCGAKSANYQMRWFTLLSEDLWGYDHFTPVGSSAGRESRVYLYNPNASTITVSYATLSSSGTTNVPPNGVRWYSMPENSGARFYTANSNKFIAVQVMDYGSHAYDWGHTLFPRPLLTEQALIGWGPGSASPSVDSSPVWVVGTTSTTLYVDYDGDPTTGTLTDPAGNKYNFSTNIVSYGMHTIYDTTDNDQTGMRVYTLNGVKIQAVWGQDPAVASAGNPHLDMGYEILPTPLVIPAKASALYSDENYDGLLNGGDILIYTVLVTRVGVPSTNNVIVKDTWSTNVTYVTNSTAINGTNITDDAVPPAATAFPLDENGYNIGPVPLGTTVKVTYRAKLKSSLPSDLEGVVNVVSADGQEFVLFTPLDEGSLVSGTVRHDLTGFGNTADLANPGIPGVTVYLYTDPNSDGDPSDGIALRTNVTGSLGNFFFDSVGPGSYVLVESDPANFFSTADTSGPNDNRIPITVVLDMDSAGHIFLDAASGLSITKTADPDGIWFPELDAEFLIRISNTGAVTHTHVNVEDYLPTGLTYVATSTVILTDTLITNNLLDQFSTTNYNNNNGDENWSGSWTESDSGGGGASGGVIQVVSGELRINGNVSGNTTASVRRIADLFGYYRATLSYDYRTTGTETDDTLRTQVSSNGVSWMTLASYVGSVTGAASYDISSFVGGDAYIRFYVPTGQYTGADDFFFADNVRVRLVKVQSQAQAGGAPPLLMTNGTLISQGKIDIVYRAIVGQVNGLTNVACVTSDIQTNSLCATLVKSVDTSAVPDRIGARVVNDLDGDGVVDVGERGIRSVTIDLYSDPNADGDPGDGMLIDTRNSDYEGYVLFGGLTAGSYVLVENDLSGFASTGDSSPPNDNRIPVTLVGGFDSLTNVFLDWTISGLNFSKTINTAVDLVPEQIVQYTLAISNTRVAAQGNVRVDDTLGDGLTYIPGTAQIVYSEPLYTNTVIDLFNAATYTNNDGVLSWPTAWIEQNDDGLPGFGDVIVTQDLGALRLRIGDDDRGIYRRLPDLTQYGTAQLSFYYRRFSLEDGEYLGVALSTNGGTAWTQIGQIGHTGSGFSTDLSYQYTNYLLSADLITTQTLLRFRTPVGGMAPGDQIYVDDIKVTLVGGGTHQEACNPPPTLLNNYVIQPYETITITLQAQVGLVDSVVNNAHLTTAGDPAGLYVGVSNLVSSAVLTQGWINAQDTAELAWLAVTNNQGQVVKSYDLIHADIVDGLVPAVTNYWSHINTYTNSNGADTLELSALGPEMRFYRVSFPDQWKSNRSPRYASAELYVGKNLHLTEGENWVSLFMVPDSNSVVGVFGTNRMPAGDGMGDATRVEWYDATAAASPTNVIWLSSVGHWLNSTGGIADNVPLPLSQGFNVVLPPGSGSSTLPLIGRVPTNHSAAYGHSVPIKANGAYNIVSYPLPYRVRLKDSGLKQAGFKGAKPGQALNPYNSDELRILQRGGGAFAAPKARILMNSSQQFWFWTGGTGSAENYPLEVDDALIIYSRVSFSNYTWDISLPYTTPNNFMNP